VSSPQASLRVCVCVCVRVCVCVCVSGCVLLGLIASTTHHRFALLGVFAHIHRSVIFGLCHTSLCVLRVLCVDINCGLGGCSAAIVVPPCSTFEKFLVGRNVSK
jgi:hypothetical protein